MAGALGDLRERGRGVGGTDPLQIPESANEPAARQASRIARLVGRPAVRDPHEDRQIATARNR